MRNIRDSKKRILLILMIATLLVLSFPQSVTRAEPLDGDPEERWLELGRELYENRDRDPYAFRDGRRRLLRSAPLPASYDLRNVDTDGDGVGDTSYVTPVKLQSPFGSCWGFAATAAAETSLLSSGIASGDIDLSEKHTAFFIRRPLIDPDSSQNGEGYIYPDPDQNHSSGIYSGGYSFYATGLYSSGAGPVSEERDERLEYHGSEEKIVYVDEIPVCYDEDDDWWIDDELRFMQDYILKESHILPNPPEILKGVYESEEEKWADFDRAVRAMKEEIKAGRPIQIGYRAPNAIPGEELKEDYINTATWAHYTYNQNTNADHEVVIIGWDDNYPKDNFVHDLSGDEESPAPERDGAWLVKNSWGSGEEEFPNRDLGDWGLFTGQDRGVYNEETEKWEYEAEDDAVQTGYFWLSYEDLSIDIVESLEFDKAVEGRTYTAQYDYMPQYNVSASFYDQEIRMANIFRMEEVTGGEPALIDCVSCQTVAPGTEVHYEIYRLNDGYQNPTDGEKVAELDTAYAYGGFHKEALEEPVLMMGGEEFSVVVTEATTDGKYELHIHYGLNKNWYDSQSDKELAYSVGIVNGGESMVYSEVDGWEDLAGLISAWRESDPWWNQRDIDNFPIKAYLTPYDTPEIVRPEARTGLAYDGTEQALVTEGSVTGGAELLYGIEDETGTVVYGPSIPTGINSGNYRVYFKVTQYGCDIDSGEIEVSIDKRQLAISFTDKEHVYDGVPHGPKASFANLCGDDEVSPVVDGGGQTDAGNYTVAVTGISGRDTANYMLPDAGCSCEYEIKKRRVTFTSGSTEEVYSGNPITNDRIVESGDGFTSGQGATFTVTGSRTEAGESDNTFIYTLKLGTDEKNYDISTVFGKLKVIGRDISYADITLGEENTYDGSAKTQGFSVSYEGHELVRGTDYEAAGDKATDVGGHMLVVTGMGNYRGQLFKNYTIWPKKDSGSSSEGSYSSEDILTSNSAGSSGVLKGDSGSARRENTEKTVQQEDQQKTASSQAGPEKSDPDKNQASAKGSSTIKTVNLVKNPDQDKTSAKDSKEDVAAAESQDKTGTDKAGAEKRSGNAGTKRTGVKKKKSQDTESRKDDEGSGTANETGAKDTGADSVLSQNASGTEETYTTGEGVEKGTMSAMEKGALWALGAIPLILAGGAVLIIRRRNARR
ncbi:MAG: hypothetical protein K6A71_01130 [Lachnospiraceae bacterium]|nr:hypothetical protein [Lachnospiraceae bacterium]